jgi:2-oxo-hept-3-ene-1,7-dioate hydratase
MPNPSLIDELAQQLQQARITRVPVRQFSKSHPELSLADAYAVQHAWVKLETASGRVVKGHKVGLTSRAIQQAFKAREPTHAPLMNDMFFAESSDIPIDRFLAPRIEAELAFVLAQPLKGPGVTLFDALGAIAFVTPAVEIIDARMELVDAQTRNARNVVDQVADFAGCAGVVVGGRPLRPDEIDLTRVPALVFRNGVIEETGVSAAVMNHPVHAVAWLANRLALDGRQLDGGELVLAGAFTRPIPVAAGDSIHVDYGCLGSIAFRWSAKE